MTARAAAAAVLVDVLGAGRSLGEAATRLGAIPERRERALARELAYGVVRDFHRLSALLGLLLERPLRRRDLDVEAHLLLGLYQMLSLRVPEHAAVSQAVEESGRGKPWSRGLVNGVLRRFQRERDALLEAADRNESARLRHPRWLLDELRRAWPQGWPAIVEAGNQRPPMALRVNARRGDRDAYRRRLDAAGLRAAIIDCTSHGLVLEQPVDVDELPGFAQGDASVQDGAAQLAAPLLAPEPGQRVLDACAAPGGKAAHIAELHPDLAELVAVDVDPARAQQVRSGLDRLGLTAVVLCADAADPAGWWDGRPFDRILLDAPCSATGVIRRHPDIKIHRRPEDVDAHGSMQRRLLEALWPLLARSGRLLYATCSVLPRENAAQVSGFLARCSDARLLPMPAAWGRPVGAGRQVLPGERGMDGFYYALLTKA